MTCISAIKSPIVLKMVSSGGYGNIIPSCTTVFKFFFLFFCLKNINKTFELSEKIRKNNGDICGKTDIS